MSHSLLVDVILSVAIGAVIDFFCLGRLLVEVVLSIFADVGYYSYLVWKFPDPDVWSWRDPITSAIYQATWFAAFYLAPTLIFSLAIGRVAAARNNK